jgi:gamma-D-glutamyl-L-lysine dipeptidyl-peptidase
MNTVINIRTIDFDVGHIAYVNTKQYNHSMQNILDNVAKSIDLRTSCFDVKIDSETDGFLALSGRVLDESQLDELPRLFPNRKLDTASIRVLNAGTHERVHVATNLTGLYEKPTFGMALSSELYFGTELEVLDEEMHWVFTRQRDGYLGWVYRPYLSEGRAPDATHLVLEPSVEVRVEPNATSETVTRVVSGTAVPVDEKLDGWSRISANKTGWIPSASLRALAELPKTIEEKRETLVEDSLRMIGVPYLWGGSSGNGIDCSGFTRLLHRWLGVEIPRDADMQWAAAKPVEPPFEVGDLLFFGEGKSDRHITHVGVSRGGWDMIHSSRGRNGVYVDDVQQRQSLKEIFVSAGSFLR